MDDDFIGGTPCQLCGSQRFHVEDGGRVCENGHIQEGGLEVGEDDADYGTQGKRVRIKEQKKAKVSRVFRGKKAYKLFLEAYQYILWKQCYALIHQKGLPTELWTVIRDLWTLRLSKQFQKLEESSKTEESDDFSSSAPESGEHSVENMSADEGQSSRMNSGSPTLVQTVALCYLGILLLRLPITLASLFRWVLEEDIVYVRAIRHVPGDIKDKLPGNYHEALETQFTLTRDHFQIAIFQLARLYERSFGMSMPSINWIAILFGYVKDLGLPLEIYAASKSLNQIIAFDFKFDVLRTRRKMTSLPEAQLMSLIIIAVKLAYPFDSDTLKRYPRNLNEPGAQRIDWSQWVEAHSQHERRHDDLGGLRRGTQVDVKDTDIMEMSEKQLDEYMDWYQRTWISNKPAGENVNRNILDFFPLKIIHEQHGTANVETEREAAVEAKLHEIQASLKIRRHVTDEEAEEQDGEVPRPGSHYAVFRSIRDLDTHPAAKAFHSAAAEAACLSLESLLRAVVQTERRITIWQKAKRRAEHFDDELDLEAESGTQDAAKLVGDLGLPRELMSEGSALVEEEDDSGSDMNMIE